MANIDRDTLEKMALEACPTYLFYELGDEIESISDDQLLQVIDGKIPLEQLHD